MPKRILHATVKDRTLVNKQWIVYSTNRMHCFKDEISHGYFGAHHVCGCSACEPSLKLPIPLFEDARTFIPAQQKRGPGQ